MNNIISLLRSEIEGELETLEKLEVGSKEYSSTVENIAKLTDRVRDLEKLQIDSDEQEKKREEAKKQASEELNLKKEQSEAELNLKKEQLEQAKAQAEAELNLKKEQMKEEKKGRIIKIFVEVAGIVVPVLVTIWGTKVSLNFEKTGSITTVMGRGFLNKLSSFLKIKF